VNESFDSEHGAGAEGESHGGRHKKHKKHSAHGGAWKVAYADFVTAMLALFIVLWVMGQDDKVKEAVSAYFRDPAGYMKTGGAPFSVGKGATLSPTAGQVKEAIEKKLEEEISRLQEVLAASEAMQQISDQIVFELTEEGIRMEFRDAPEFSFFKVGSAQVTPQMEELFKVLTPEICKLDYPVAIEGHTDRRPYGMRDYTNWELSADRANAVRRIMLNNGMPMERMSEVRAYADTKPIKPADPFAVDNRRVSILLKSPLLLSLGK
jgi:chemotaxis protein MotB